MIIRKGPHPLSVHIGMAASEMARSSAMNADQDPAIYQQNFSDMLRGVQRYQCWGKDVHRPKLEEIYRAGQLSLNVLSESKPIKNAPLILLVPSMINRSYILNLTHDRSMMRFFADQHVNPVLLDWGESKLDPQQANFDALMQDRFIPVLKDLEHTYGQKPHLMGYCMGGMMCAAACTLTPERIASATFLATPWDFHAGTASLKQRVEFWQAGAHQAMEGKDYLDQDWLQTIFASLDPLLTRDKFMKFARMDEGTPEADLFIAIEDWLNDGVDLPANIARTCIMDWFGQNAPCENKWSVTGQTIKAENITAPSLVIASRADRLVEYESANALYNKLPNAKLHTPSCGHIGMIAGRGAIKNVWQPIIDFINACHL